MRIVDPGTLQRGGGLAASRSVEASSFVHSRQGLDGLVAHVTDPSRAHMAAAIGVVDAAGFFASHDVEGALEEVVTSAGMGRQSGVYEGCSGTLSGLDFTLDTPSTVILEGTYRTVSGMPIPLTDNASNWIYIEASTGNLTRTASAPTLADGDVLLWHVVLAGGVPTERHDLRWFVRNLDRKVTMTVRSVGSVADSTEEAAFQTLDTAFQYLSTYSSEILSTTIILKGPHTVESTLTVPVDNVTILGEGGATLQGPSSGDPILDVTGRSGVTLEGLAFQCETAGAPAVIGTGGEEALTIRRCVFRSGADDWDGCVYLSGTSQRVLIEHSQFESVGTAINLTETTESSVHGCVVNGAATGGTVGIALGSSSGPNSTGQSHITGCEVNLFQTGLYLRGVGLTASRCWLAGSALGVGIEGGSTDVVLDSNVILLEVTAGNIGVYVNGDRTTITNCYIRNERMVHSGDVPVGVSVEDGVQNFTLSNTYISNFVDTGANVGAGVLFVGEIRQANLADVFFEEVDTAIYALDTMTAVKITSCSVSGARIGFFIRDDVHVSDCLIQLDSTTGLVGIELSGNRGRLDSCRITNPRTSYSPGDVPAGLILNGTTQTQISNSLFYGFYNAVDATGAGILTSNTPEGVIIQGCSVLMAGVGIDAVEASQVNISDTQIREVITGISLGQPDNNVSGCYIEVDPTVGLIGIQVSGDRTVISGTSCVNNRVTFGANGPIGISCQASNVSITGCILTGWADTGGGAGSGVECLTGCDFIQVTGTQFVSCYAGINSFAGNITESCLVSNCTFESISSYGVFVIQTDQVVMSDCIYSGAGASAFWAQFCTDVVITGNTVQGDSTLYYGIRVLGINTGAGRSRRVLVQNNTIAAIVTVGIQLSGYVQNGNVSGNQVDAGLAAGDPTAVCIELTTSGTSTTRYLSISDNILWRGRSGINISGVSLSQPALGIRVAQNNIHHCARGVTGTTTCNGIWARWTNNLVVENNQISRIGLLISDANAETAPVGGPDVNPLGILVEASTGVSITGNQVSRCIAAGAGTSFGIGVTATSQANAIATAFLTIQNNQVIGDSVTPHTLGIYVQYGQEVTPGAVTILSGLVIQGNTVTNTESYALSVGIGGGATLSQASISGNSVQNTTDVTGHGILLVAQSSTDFTAGVISDVNITGNNVNTVSGTGIYIWGEDGGSITRVQIQDNHVYDTDAEGICVFGDTTPAAFNDIDLSGNVVGSATNAALQVIASDIDVNRITVSNNQTNGSGIFIGTLTSAVNVNDINSLKVDGNSVSGGGVEVLALGSLNTASISHNRITHLAGVPLTVGVSAGTTIGVEAYSRDLQINGNQITGSSGSILYVSRGHKMSGAQVVGNTFRTRGLSITVAEATVGAGDAVQGLTISGNSFVAIPAVALSVSLGTSAVIDGCSDINIVGNDFDTCNTASGGNNVLLFSNFCSLRNLRVEGNTFKSCGSQDLLSGVMELQFGAGGSAYAGENVLLARNSFNRCYGPGIYVLDNTTATNWTLVNLTLQGNLIHENVYTGVFLNLGAFGPVRNLSVQGNQIHQVSGASVDGGIYLAGPTAATLEQLSVVENQIKTVGANTAAMLISLPETFNDLIVDRNQINDVGEDGIKVVLDGLWTGGSVSGNLVSSATLKGIHIQVTAADAGFTGMRGVAVCQNVVRAAGTDGILITATTDTTTPILHNVQVDNNTVSYTGAVGIGVEAFLGTEVQALSLSNNSLWTTTTDGLSISLSGGVDATNVAILGNRITSPGGDGISVSGVLATGDLLNFNISNNIIFDVEEHGILVALPLGNIADMSVSNNNIRNFAKTTGGTRGGITLRTIDAQEVVLSSNTIRNNYADSIGLFCEITGVTRTFAVTSNMINMEGVSTTESMRFDSYSGASQLNMSITGNSFRGAVTGVNFNGSSFSPDRSVCAMNNERTSGGAGNWAAFTAAFSAKSVTTPNQD